VLELLKYSAAALGLSYAIGMIVLNSYMFFYGVAEFELIRARYISCGILVLAILFALTSILLKDYERRRDDKYFYYPTIWSDLTLAATLLVFALLSVTERKINLFSLAEMHVTSASVEYSFAVGRLYVPIVGEFHAKEFSFWLYVYFAIASVSMIVLKPIEESYAKEREQCKTFTTGHKLCVAYNLIAALIMLLYTLITVQSSVKYLLLWSYAYWWVFNYLAEGLHDSQGGEHRQNGQIRNYNLTRVGFGLTLVMLLVVFFGRYFYPFLSPAVGGGRAQSGFLVPRQENAAEMERLTENQLVEVVDQSDKYYYVLLADENDAKGARVSHMVQIKKEVVSGVVYEPPRVKLTKINDRKRPIPLLGGLETALE